MILKELLKLLQNIFYLKGAKGEDKLANHIALELKAMTIEGTLKAVWFHVPNETKIKDKKDLISLRKKTSLGLIPGAPDFVFLSKNKAICIELKTDTGKQSDNQKLFQTWCDNDQVPYYIARSIDDVKKILKQEEILV